METLKNIEMLIFKEITFVLIISIGCASSESLTLWERLNKEKEWEAHDTCATNPIVCFNLRKVRSESILRRAGIDASIQMNIEKKLKVSFHAKKEGVDVCGKTTPLKEVKPFELPEDGSPLHRPAEDYRNPPNVWWDAEKGVFYSLVFLDVTLLKIRGWWSNIALQGNESLKGQVVIRYSPPANPTPITSPILILLLRQNSSKSYDQQEWYRNCVVMSPSENDAAKCRNKFITIVSESNVVGAQLYHTNGSSLYEKYRACTESLPCHQECIEKFARYHHGIEFMLVVPSQLDHYVNVHFYTSRPYDESELPDTEDAEKSQFGGMGLGGMGPGQMGFGGMGLGGLGFEDMGPPAPISPAPTSPENKNSGQRYVDVRARPGDNMHVRNSDTRAKGNELRIKMNLEIGIPMKYFVGDILKYSVLIVDQDAPGMKMKPFGHYYVANLQLPHIFDINSENIFQGFVDFTPPSGFHRYHILLFSHADEIRHNVLGQYYAGWDLKLLASNHKLRAVSWMLVNINDDIACPPGGYGGCMRPQPYTTEQVGKDVMDPLEDAGEDEQEPPVGQPVPESEATNVSRTNFPNEDQVPPVSETKVPNKDQMSSTRKEPASSSMNTTGSMNMTGSMNATGSRNATGSKNVTTSASSDSSRISQSWSAYDGVICLVLLALRSLYV